jgi:hypothetical protein
VNQHRDLTPAGLARLLGPGTEEVSCQVCFDLLDELVERDLAGGEPMPAMHAHLEGCPACREDYDSLRALVAEGP